MKYNNDFKYDLKLGQKGENYLANILKGKKIEVKTDLQAKKTGNVFVEYKSRGKPSGISTTESEWYAFVVSNENIFLIRTDNLKLKCKKYGKKRKGGDSNTSEGILLPLEKLLK